MGHKRRRGGYNLADFFEIPLRVVDIGMQAGR